MPGSISLLRSKMSQVVKACQSLTSRGYLKTQWVVFAADIHGRDSCWLRGQVLMAMVLLHSDARRSGLPPRMASSTGWGRARYPYQATAFSRSSQGYDGWWRPWTSPWWTWRTSWRSGRPWRPWRRIPKTWNGRRKGRWCSWRIRPLIPRRLWQGPWCSPLLRVPYGTERVLEVELLERPYSSVFGRVKEIAGVALVEGGRWHCKTANLQTKNFKVCMILL